MKCPGCQHENPPQAKFCLECGTPFRQVNESDLPGAPYMDLQRSLREALEQQKAMAEILRVISTSPANLQTVLEEIARSAARFCGAPDASIFGLDGGNLRSEAHHGSVSQPTGFLVPLVRGTVAGRSVLERQAVGVTDLQSEMDEYPEGSALARQTGQRATLSVPLLREGAPIGVILLRRAEALPFTDMQIALLKTFADQAVIAIENVRLFKELQTSNAELREALDQQTATSEILRVISSSPTDEKPVFDAIARSSVQLCAAAFAVVASFDGELLHFVAGEHVGTEGRRTLAAVYPMRPDRGQLAGRAILDRTVIHVADVMLDPEYVGASLGNRATLSVPMLRTGAPIGTITIARSEPVPFTEQQITLLKTFIAIENTRLFTELQEKNRALTQAHAQVTESLAQQTATSEILRVISSSPTDVQPVFQAIVGTGVRLCEASYGFLARYDGTTMTIVAHFGATNEEIETVLRLYPMAPTPDSLGGRTILERAVIHIPDVRSDPTYGPRVIQDAGWRTGLGVPLLREGAAIGLLGMWRRDVRPFSDRQIELLKTFADQAVIAIENVRLFKELESKNRDLTTALEQQTATSEILRTITQTQTDVQPVFDTIVQSAARLCHAANAAIFLTDGRMVYEPANFGSSPEALAATRARFPRPVDMDSTAGIAILTRSVFHVSDTEDPSVIEHLRQSGRLAGFRSAVTVPMLRESEAVGAVLVARREPGRFSDAEVGLLKTFADQAVIAVENVRLFKELESSNRELRVALEQQTATSELLRVIGRSTFDLQPVFETLVENAVRLCEAERAFIFRYDGEVLRVAATHNVSPARRDFAERHPIGPGRYSAGARAALERRTIHIHDIQADPEYTYQVGQSDPAPTRTVLSVPMLRADELLGVITIFRHEVRPFTDSQIALMETFADQAVIAIENVRLFEELETRTAALTRSVDQLTALGEVGRAVSSTLNLETVLTTIVSRAVELSRLDGGVVFEYDEDDQEFVQRAQAETGGALAAARRATRIQKGEGVVGRTASTLEPVQVFDITAPGAYVGPNRENLIESGVRAILAVPMVREGQLIGCLGVTRNQPGEFPTETIELLRTFATQSALAIQNARLFQEIEDKSRQLEAASQHKSEFLANMSHELRTPLNAIIGFSEVLTDRMFGDLNEKQEEYLKDIYASGTHLLSLINDILDLSKVEAGRMELEITDFHLPTALDNALTLVRERAGRRGIALHTNVDERLGQIQADERKIRQVVLNLLSNAIKFTSEGGRIEVRAVPVDGSVEVSVSDTGVGIAPEDQEAVFEEFRQVGTAAKKVEGTGLGLALSRKFIELHGGRIWVKSEVGTGSTFTFTIPVRRGE